MAEFTPRPGFFCLETGNPADDSWLIWDGGPEHNGLMDN
jgi:hypothetical protein